MRVCATVEAMSTFPSRVRLGKSSLEVSPLGIAGGYDIGERPLLSAFERGVNYFYHGSFRRDGMTQAVRSIVAKGQREKLVLLLQSYSRFAWLLERTFRAGLRKVGTDYADVLLLGLFNDAPPKAVLERALRLKELGLVRHLAISAHRRSAFLEHASSGVYDIFHVRYNAAHPGAETDIFSKLPLEGRPGIVAYTATSWGKLITATGLPQGMSPMRGRDCYRFVLSNPDFNACMMGPRNESELVEAMSALEEGPLSPDEDARFRALGRHLHG